MHPPSFISFVSFILHEIFVTSLPGTIYFLHQIRTGHSQGLGKTNTVNGVVFTFVMEKP